MEKKADNRPNNCIIFQGSQEQNVLDHIYDEHEVLIFFSSL